MIPGYLLKMGRMKEEDREFFDALVQGLKQTGGKPRDSGGLASDPELASKLRDAYDTISKLERRNLSLADIIESLKSTYEFFEVCNDMKVLYGNPRIIQ